MNYSPAAAELIRQLEDPSKWSVGKHTILHRPSATAWWVYNGAFSFNFYGGAPPCLGLIERHFLWPHVKRLISESVARKLKEGKV